MSLYFPVDSVLGIPVDPVPTDPMSQDWVRLWTRSAAAMKVKTLRRRIRELERERSRESEFLQSRSLPMEIKIHKRALNRKLCERRLK